MKLYLLAITCLISTAVTAQYSLTGKVVDQETQNVLAGANITTAAGTQATASDKRGQFVLSGLKKGKTTLIVSYVGFGTQELVVEIPYDKTLIIEMTASMYLTDEVLVTATRASDKMPLTFSQIEKEDIETVNMGKDIPYLLESMPSVVTTSDAGTGVGYTGMRIRGSDATRINVTLNGIPYNDSESQGVYWVDLPDMASSVESIQVQRGVGTSTNGPGAFGASVNVQTTGLNEEPYAVLDNSFGSFNTWKHTLKLGTGLINEAFTIDGRISKIKSDGYIKFTSITRWVI